jgi:hypothetical protein
MYCQTPKTYEPISFPSARHTRTAHLPTAHLPTAHLPTAHLPSYCSSSYCTAHLPTAHLPKAKAINGVNVAFKFIKKVIIEDTQN